MLNSSGLEPRGRAVLVMVDDIRQTKSSAVIIPDIVKEKTDMVEQNATIVAIGPCAWMDEGFWEPFFFGLFRRWRIIPRAAIGERVLITKFAGYMTKGPRDEGRYRLVNDRDIFGAVTWSGPAEKAEQTDVKEAA